MPGPGTKKGMPLINSRLILRFGTYTFFSGLAALVNFSSRFLYEMIPGVNFLFAVTLAYISGMIVNFISSKWIVFASAQTGKTKREAVKFIFIALLGLIATVIVSDTCLHILKSYGLPEMVTQNLVGIESQFNTLAHLTGMAVGLVANFLGHELVSFKETGMWTKFKNKYGSEKE